jgi:hypothetical protein
MTCFQPHYCRFIACAKRLKQLVTVNPELKPVVDEKHGIPRQITDKRGDLDRFQKMKAPCRAIKNAANHRHRCSEHGPYLLGCSNASIGSKNTEKKIFTQGGIECRDSVVGEKKPAFEPFFVSIRLTRFSDPCPTARISIKRG